jgi:chemotaxis protein methyltransferase CheR
MDDQQFRQLLIHFQYSWAGYRKVRKGVKKRINRHMHQLGCRNMDAYLDKLDQSHKTRQACERLMTVSISRFFRDRQFWHTLEKKLLPELLESRAEKVKVWSAGCACGEEAYSFKIVWEGLKKSYDNGM